MTGLQIPYIRTQKSHVLPRNTNGNKSLLEMFIAYKICVCVDRVHVENDDVIKSFEYYHVPHNVQTEKKLLIYNLKHDARTSAHTSHGDVGHLANQIN